MESCEKMLSVIIPAHNEEQTVERAAEAITAVLAQKQITYELIFVNDGSTDQTWANIQALCQKNKRIRGVCFSRQFGKEAAIYAGMQESRGDCCVVIDCDLQHPPEKILEMWELWTQGYEIVEAVKRCRGEESTIRAFSARCFYSIISRSTGIDLKRSSDFKLLDRKAVLVLLNMKEHNTFFRALSSWIGFKTAQVEFDVQERVAGRTNWSNGGLVRYAVSNITSFTAAPLHIITVLGILMLIAAVILGGEALYRWSIGEALEGFTTVILLQLFTGSILMISIGILGYYIYRIYEEAKGRPRFIISETCGQQETKARGALRS